MKTILIVFLALVGLTLAAQTNVTVDDSNSTAIAFTGNGWLTESTPGLARPERTMVWMGTWHDNTRSGNDTIDDPRSIKMVFDGVAVYLYCVLFLAPYSSVTTQTNLTFTLDGRPMGSYVNSPQLTSDYSYTYNIPVFKAQNLENKHHTLLVDIEWNSVVLFDYAVYTMDLGNPSTVSANPSTTGGITSSSAPSQTSNNSSSDKSAAIGAAVGATVGVVALITGIVLFVLYRRRRQRTERIKNEQNIVEIEPSPFTLQPAPLPPRGGSVYPQPGVLGQSAVSYSATELLSYGDPSDSSLGIDNPTMTHGIDRQSGLAKYSTRPSKEALASSSRQRNYVPQVEQDAGPVSSAVAIEPVTLPPPYMDRRVGI